MKELSRKDYTTEYGRIDKSFKTADTYEATVRTMYEHTLTPDSVAIDCGGNKAQPRSPYAGRRCAAALSSFKPQDNTFPTKGPHRKVCS